MIQVNEIAFIGYPTRDRAQAKAFYEGLFDLKVTEDMDMGDKFWTEYDIGNSTFALSNYWDPSSEPAMGPTVAFEVGNYEETLTWLKSKGATIVETHESPVCFMSMVTDLDGNSFWIHKRKSAPATPEKVLAIPFICYPITDRARANTFYEGLLGLKTAHPDYNAPDGFWSEYLIGDGALAVCNFWKPAAKPSMGPAIALEVDDFDQAMADITAAGVVFDLAPTETPVCHLCVIADPDGNSLFIHKRKPQPA